MIKKILCLGLVTYFSQIAIAQKIEDKTEPGSNVLTIRTYPLKVIDLINPSLVVGVETGKENSKRRFFVDAGALFNIQGIDNDRVRKYGFFLSSGVRFILTKSNETQHETALEAFVATKTYFISSQEWIGVNCENGIPDFNELRDVKIRQHVILPTVNISRRWAISKNKNTSLELYGGLGLRLRRSILTNPKPTGLIRNYCLNEIPGTLSISELEEPGNNYLLPNLTLGVRLNFSLLNKK
jgi:hypothetical protein